MFKSIKTTLLVTIITTSLLITACGGKATAEASQEMDKIQTAVAATVAAQDTAEAANTPAPAGPTAPVFTQTPLRFSPTLTPLAPLASPTLPSDKPKSECASASLISETIPDGTIFKPGEKFTKTWEIKNTSTCVWNTTYKIIFWDGDVLGGSYVYNLPQAVGPGQTFPISLLLVAPKTATTVKSEWKLETPDGIKFGVGQYNASFYVQVAVSVAATPNYGVTAVDYKMVREPATGCPANVDYILYATVATSGPIELTYYWAQSDGNDGSPTTIKIDSATTTVLKHHWKLHIATNTGTRWMAFVVVSPNPHVYPHAEFTKTCGG
jgi:hypothetical protein